MLPKSLLRDSFIPHSKDFEQALTDCVIKWTAIAGGSAALVSAIFTYVILRCIFGRIPQDAQAISSTGAERGQLDTHHTRSEVTNTQSRSEEHATQEKTSDVHNLLPEWLSKLVPQNLPCISFEGGESISFESIREKMKSRVTFLKGGTSAIVLDLLIKHNDLDPNYIARGQHFTTDLPSSSNFRMLIVVANNVGDGRWRLISEEKDILHRTKIYRTSHIFPDNRGLITYYFDPVNSPKINLDLEEEPSENRLQWLLSRLLTNQTIKIPEFEMGIFEASKRVGTWEICLAPDTHS